MNAPLELEDAQARLLALAGDLPIEHLAIAEALGHYLAAPLLARRTQPAADISAMDGYAVRRDDLVGPWRLVGESAAGHPYTGVIVTGKAVRISTGARVPIGENAVLVQEDCARQGDTLTLTGDGPAPADKHIRRMGMDFTQGAELLPAGVRIGPAQMALAITAGHGHLPVRRRIKVAIIDSGDELVTAGNLGKAHQIPASNGAMLAAMIGHMPVDILRIGPVADTLQGLLTALADAGDADVIITSGGASVGDHDLIRPALTAWGAQVAFWKVAIKPGKPVLVAKRDRQIILGLPGNPVSSMVTGYFFMLPLLRRILGATDVFPRRITTHLAEPMDGGGARREFVRGIWDGVQVSPSTQHDSGALASLAQCNILIDRAKNAPLGKKGDEVGIFLLENGGIA